MDIFRLFRYCSVYYYRNFPHTKGKLLCNFFFNIMLCLEMSSVIFKILSLSFYSSTSPQHEDGGCRGGGVSVVQKKYFWEGPVSNRWHLSLYMSRFSFFHCCLTYASTNFACSQCFFSEICLSKKPMTWSDI